MPRGTAETAGKSIERNQISMGAIKIGIVSRQQEKARLSLDPVHERIFAFQNFQIERRPLHGGVANYR